MKAQHTPGPWRAVPTTVKGAGSARQDIVSDGAPFAPSFVAGDILPQDAQLIAATPDLLAALVETADQLEDLIEAVEGLSGLDSFHKDALANSRVVLRAVARKTIAKTEGRG